MRDTTRLKRLRDLVASPSTDFDYVSTNYPSCGTSACFGGWASWLAVNEDGYERHNTVYGCRVDGIYHMEFSAKWLGLTPGETDALFFGDSLSEAGLESICLSACSRKQAVARLDTLIAWIEESSNVGA